MKSSKRILILKILLFQILLFQIYAETIINFPSENTLSFDQENSPTYLTININNYDEIKEEYLHISTSSNDRTISPLIISSSTQSQPSIKNSDLYSTQRFGDAHLILGKDLLNKQIYLNITCNKFPCNLKINLVLEKNPILNPGQIFSYFVKNDKNSLMVFKIPSQTAKSSIINKSAKHLLNIAISYSNENLIENELFLNLLYANIFKDPIKLDINYNMGKGIIYTFVEEDLITSKEGDPDAEGNYYILNVLPMN